jgi:hypothetical protein
MTPSPGRFPWTAALSAILLLLLFEYLCFLPLRPTAWGGPRGAGFFEEGQLPAAGRFAREARLHLEAIAKWRSPDRVLEATAEALAGFHALLAAARYGVLWIVLWRMSGRGWLATIAVLASALPIAFGAPRQTEADVGLLLFVILMCATTSKRLSWLVAAVALPVLFAVWANAHCSAVVGLAWLGAMLLGRAIEWWQAYERFDDDRPNVLRLLVACLLCFGATCINPDGPKLFVDAFAVTKNPGVGALPAWQPVDFSKPAGMPWAYFATIAGLLLFQVANKRPVSPTALVVLLSFGFWPLVQQRGQDYWWLIAAWISVPLAADVVRGVCGSASPSLGASGSARVSPLMRWLLIGGLAVAAAATPAARWFVLGKPRDLRDSTSLETPSLLAQELTAAGERAGRHLPQLREVIRAAYPNGQYRGAILAGEEQGDFLGWVLDGNDRQPVMMYSRPEVIERAHWTETRRALDGAGDWWEILGRHQINLVVIDGRQFTKLASRLLKGEEWRIVQNDGVLLVAVRKEPKLPLEMMRPDPRLE